MLELQMNRKTPRLILAHSTGQLASLHDSFLQPARGAEVIWENGERSSVLDISLSGIILSPSGRLAKTKVGNEYFVRLKLEGLENHLEIRIKTVRVQSNWLGFAFVSQKTAERLIIEQPIKDQIAKENTREYTTKHFHPPLQANFWWHAPFDTNLFIWTSETGKCEKIVVEYDNLICMFEGENCENITWMKSSGAAIEARGYEAPLFENAGTVSVGASWIDRCIKWMTSISEGHPLKLQVLHLLKTLKTH